MDLSCAPLLQHITKTGTVTLLLPSSSPTTVQSVFLVDFEINISELLQLPSLLSLKILKLQNLTLSAKFRGILEFPQLERLAFAPAGNPLRGRRLDIIDQLIAPKLRFLSLGVFSKYPQWERFPSLAYVEIGWRGLYSDPLKNPQGVEYLRLPRPHPLTEDPALDALCLLDTHGKVKLMPSLRIVECHYHPKRGRLLEKLIATRNKSEEERPGMDFSLKLHALDDTVDNRLELESFLAEHPFSTADARQSHVDWFALDEPC